MTLFFAPCFLHPIFWTQFFSGPPPTQFFKAKIVGADWLGDCGKTPLSPYFPADLKCIKLADLKQVETCIKLAPSIFITNNKILIDKSEYSGRIQFLGSFEENISKGNEVKTWHISWIVYIIFIFFDDCFNDTKSYSIMAW